MNNNRRTSEDKLGHAKREIKALNAKLAQQDDEKQDWVDEHGS
jgi:hypothetical protein